MGDQDHMHRLYLFKVKKEENAVQLRRCFCTRALIFTKKLPKIIMQIGGCGAKIPHGFDPGAFVSA